MSYQSHGIGPSVVGEKRARGTLAARIRGLHQLANAFRDPADFDVDRLAISELARIDEVAPKKGVYCAPQVPFALRLRTVSNDASNLIAR